MTLDTAKRLVFEAALEVGTAMVRIDPRASNVRLPEQYKTTPMLVLRLAHNLLPPMNIDSDAYGITTTISFAGVPTPCFLPWDAIGQIWEETRREIMIVVPCMAVVELAVEVEKPRPKFGLVPLPEDAA